MSVKFTEHGIQIGGFEYPLYSGTVHYWRLERGMWGKLLDSVVGLGFKFVETYVPWSVHEIEPGVFDFGSINKNNDIDYFLSLCAEKGLFVLIRPGPHINAEMSNFGFPEWVLHDPGVQAHDATDSPVQFPFFTQTFPIPSYASTRLFELMKLYFNALASILLRHQYPHGAMVAMQSDNETCYFFRDRAYTLDYCKDSICLYRKMLAEKYQSIQELNQIYGSFWQTFDEIDPPRGFRAKVQSEIPYYLDWVQYKEWQIRKSILDITTFWQTVGITTPFFHNAAWQTYTPIDIAGLEREAVDVCGIDIYANQESSERVKTTVKFLSGTSKLAFIPEFGSGAWFDNQKTYQPAEQEFISMYSFMHGLKAANYYMIVERERWQGSPITQDNRIRDPYYDSFLRMLSFLKNESMHLYHRNPSVLILKSHDAARYKACYSVMDPNPLVSNTFIRGFELPSKLFKPIKGIGFDLLENDESSYTQDDWVVSICNVFDRCFLDYDISDTNISLERLARYPVVLCSSYEFMSKDSQMKLTEYAMQGGQLLMGPCLPRFDETMNKNKILKEINIISDPNVFVPADYGLIPRYRADKPGIEIVTHEKENDVLLFAANVTNEDCQVTIQFDGEKIFYPKWNAKNVNGQKSFRTLLQAYSVAVWRVEENK